jgi:hypothetical protein
MTTTPIGMPKRKPRGRAWPKGQSGNPNGRPVSSNTPEMKQLVADVRALAQASGAQSIALLERLRDDENVPPAVRAMAANSLLDRGYGRPPQAIDLNATVLTGQLEEADPLDLIESRLAGIRERSDDIEPPSQLQ